MKPSPVEKLLALIGGALADGTFVKVTLSAFRGPDRSLKSVHIRRVDLREAPHLSFVYRHATRDVTKNLPVADGLALLQEIVGPVFRNAHLFTTRATAQLEIRDGHGARLREGPPQHAEAPPAAHDRTKARPVPPGRDWLRALNVTTADGQVARGMESKYRQISKFVELFATLARDAGLDGTAPVSVVDMGCGKGYLTFAVHDWLRARGSAVPAVRGIEVRPELVELCNRAAVECEAAGLTFEAGHIADISTGPVDVLIALHACDTATDDALAHGVAARARLILVSPCCHKELRPQLVAPPALAGALRHGILRERQAEFVTDALRAALLEWAGYETRVFEFISTEHTAKNLMIAAIRRESSGPTPEAAAQVRALAAEYGIRQQRLAAHLGFGFQ